MEFAMIKKISAIVYPEGNMAILSKVEVNQLLNSIKGSLYISGEETDNQILHHVL
jgi:hypothetical protein